MEMSLVNENDNNNNSSKTQVASLNEKETIVEVCSNNNVLRMEDSSKQTDIGTQSCSNVDNEEENEDILDKTIGPISSRIVQQNKTNAIEDNNNKISNANTGSHCLSSPQNSTKINNHIEIKPKH